MAARKSTRPDMGAILGSFADARSVIETACRALERAEGRDHGDETVALRTGLTMLNAAYNRLDVAIGRLS